MASFSRGISENCFLYSLKLSSCSLLLVESHHFYSIASVLSDFFNAGIIHFCLSLGSAPGKSYLRSHRPHSYCPAYERRWHSFSVASTTPSTRRPTCVVRFLSRRRRCVSPWLWQKVLTTVAVDISCSTSCISSLSGDRSLIRVVFQAWRARSVYNISRLSLAFHGYPLIKSWFISVFVVIVWPPLVNCTISVPSRRYRRPFAPCLDCRMTSTTVGVFAAPTNILPKLQGCSFPLDADTTTSNFMRDCLWNLQVNPKMLIY